MLRHLRATYVIDMESHRVHGHYPYHLTGDFRLTENMMPLCEFQLKFVNDDLHAVFEFHVEGKAGEDDHQGFYLRPARLVVITTPIGSKGSLVGYKRFYESKVIKKGLSRV